MKSVKMFGKKILIVLLATMLLVSTAAIVVPVGAETQTVTGTTYLAYSVTVSVPFGNVAPGTIGATSAGAVDIIKASSLGNTIEVTLAAQGGGVVNALEELRYVAGTVPGTLDPDLPLTIWNEVVPTYPLGATITLTADATLSMVADTGVAIGSWGTITITVTVT